MDKKIAVMVCDDSALMRKLISKIIESSPDMEVVGTAMNGEFALQKIPRLKPDVIVLDLEMPQMNGIEFLKERKKLKIETPVVILSSIARRGAKITMEALDLGASDFIMKPSGSISEDIQIVGEKIIKTVRAYAVQYLKKKGVKSENFREPDYVFKPKPVEPLPEIRTHINLVGQQPAMPEIIKLNPHRGRIEIVAIGISTGGPNALRKVLAGINASCRIPILIVQHMPAGFTNEFAKSLDRICPLEVKEAEEGDIIKPGRVFIAPGNRHMNIVRKPLAKIIHLSESAPVNGHRPSVDVLFSHIAEVYSDRSMAIIMTGMGKDGARRIGTIAKAGGLTIGQDEASSIVYGMPKVAKEYGYLHHVVALDDMAGKITNLLKEFNG